MFQNYISPAAIDPNLPYVLAPTDGKIGSYSSRQAGVSFRIAGPEFPLQFDNLAAAPEDSVLIVNASAHVAALSVVRVVFNGPSGVLCQFPIAGNGLGISQGAVPIPRDTTFVSLVVDGISGDFSGQIRVVSREHIPYQPLKG